MGHLTASFQQRDDRHPGDHVPMPAHQRVAEERDAGRNRPRQDVGATAKHARQDPDEGRRRGEVQPERRRIVQTFLNSVDLEDGVEAFGTTDGVRDWIVAHGLAGPALQVTEGDRERAIRLREGLRDLLAAHTGDPVDGATREGLDAVLQGVSLTVRFAGDGPGLQATGRGIDAVFGQLVAIIQTAAIDGTWNRLKTCRNSACRWAFYDASKNRSGTWCAMAICGARDKARSYRRRQPPPA